MRVAEDRILLISTLTLSLDLDTNLHELSVLRGVLPHLRHPQSLHGVQLVGKIGQVHGRVELSLEEGVEAVLSTE